MSLEFFILIISLIISISALILTIAKFWKYIKLTKSSFAIPIVINMFNEFRSDDFKKRIKLIREELPEGDPSNSGFLDLDDDMREDVRYVSHFFDNLGIFVHHGLIDEKIIIGFMGDNILELWKKLKPYIQNEKDKRNLENYQAYFQELVYQIQKNPPENIRDNLHKLLS
ncbi:MAG: DUF4760 domain-containing protein [Candidatus Hodarchaeota archaeon]